MAQVRVTIDPKDGTVKYEVNGVAGIGCEEITRALEESNEVMQKQYTEEYSEQQELPDYLHEGE